jgi:hypothetical protein
MKRSALRRQDAVANMREALARRAGRGTGLSSGIGFALGRSKNARILARARSRFDRLTTNGAWEFTTNGMVGSPRTGLSNATRMKRSAIRENVIPTLSKNERISARVRSWFL